jgi:hypothetical protein
MTTGLSPFFSALHVLISARMQFPQKVDCEFLYSCINPIDGSVNYFHTTDPYSNSIPDDIDDTVLLYEALHILQPEGLTASQLATITNLLIHAEVRPGGPYMTWLNSDVATNTVDKHVNQNIRRLLSTLEVPMPKLSKVLMDPDRLATIYYRSPALIYALSILNCDTSPTFQGEPVFMPILTVAAGVVTDFCPTLDELIKQIP